MEHGTPRQLPKSSSSSATLSVTEGKKWREFDEGIETPCEFPCENPQDNPRRHYIADRNLRKTLIEIHNSSLSVTEAHPNTKCDGTTTCRCWSCTCMAGKELQGLRPEAHPKEERLYFGEDRYVMGEAKYSKEASAHPEDKEGEQEEAACSECGCEQRHPGTGHLLCECPAPLPKGANTEV